MNRFQKALDDVIAEDETYTIVYKFNYDKAYEKIKKHVKGIKTLQELIDKYNNMLGDYMSYQDLKAEYESQLNLYKKALDKACKELEMMERQLNDEFGGGFNFDVWWKEYLLKESEKQ